MELTIEIVTIFLVIAMSIYAKDKYYESTYRRINSCQIDSSFQEES